MKIDFVKATPGVLACVLLPVFARTQMQMQMPMPMGDSQQRGSSTKMQSRAPAQEKRSRHASPDIPQQQEVPPAMPFGRLADGDTSAGPRPVPPAQAVLGKVQEGEHPQRQTGTEAAPMPDLLAEAKSREPRALPFFLQEAGLKNPTLREAEAEVHRLQSEAKQAGLWQNPEVGYEADHVRGGSYAGGEQGGFVQQTIPLAGQRSSARAAIEAQRRAAEVMASAQAERVQSAVQQAFYAALVAQREVELHEQLAELAADNTMALHQYANVGQADAPDVLGSEVEREKARLELASAQRAYRKAFAVLAALSGDAEMPVSLLTGDLESVPALREGAAVESADKSPLVQTARQQAAASEAQIRSARAQAGPELTLKAGLQQDNEPLDPSLRRVGVVGIAQAGLTLPLWNRNQGAVAAAKASQSGAQAEVARVQLRLRAEAEQAVQDYDNAMDQAQRYRSDLLPRAQRAAELYDTKYAAMAAAFPQRVAAHRMLLQLKLEYTRQLSSAWQNAILLQHGLLQDGLAAPAEMTGQAASGERN